MLFVVEALRKSMGESCGSTKDLIGLAGVGGDNEGASDSEEEDSSEVSSSDSVGWPEIPLEGTGGGVGDGMGLNESDQNDEGRCNWTWISDFLGVNHGIQALLPEERPLWGAK